MLKQNATVFLKILKFYILRFLMKTRKYFGKIYFPERNIQNTNDDCGIFTIIHVEHYIAQNQIMLDKLDIPTKRKKIQKQI